MKIAGRLANPRLGVDSLRNVILSPLLPGSGKAVFRFYTDEQHLGRFQHLRSRTGGVIVDAAKDEPLPTTVNSTMTVGEAVYGGILINHFGHFIAESLHRLWPLYSGDVYSNLPIAFHISRDLIAADRNLPGFMNETFAYIGIDLSKILIIDEVIKFDVLHIPTQASILGMGPVDDQYNHLIGRKARGRRAPLGQHSNIFVSRANYLHTGSILGEELLIDCLSGEGQFLIVYPEKNAIADLVSHYETARNIVFVEGSAIHTVELCDTVKASIFVVCKGTRQAAENLHFGGMLKKKAGEIFYYENSEKITPLKTEIDGLTPYWAHASSFVDLLDLINCINRFCGTTVKLPSPEALKRAYQSSLARLVLDSAMTPKHVSNQQLGNLLRILQKQVARLKLI